MSHVAEDRIVFTYAPDETSLGLLTGYGLGTMFVLEHVVVFPDAPRVTLLRLLEAGLAEAWARYASVVFCLPKTWTLTPSLRSLGEHFGFVAYAEEEELTWYVAWKP